MKILIIAPHPDDEVLGCGGTIKKYSNAGNEVYLCVVTKAYTPDWTQDFIENRKSEIVNSNQVLGIKKTFFLDFPTVKLDTVPQKELNDSILKIVKEVNPEIIFIPFEGDANKDHKLVFQAVMIALRPMSGLSVKKVFSYSTESNFMPNYYEDISDYIEDKLKAMECYKSELKDYPHPRSLEGIKVLSQKRGMESGLKNAEAFLLIREIK